MTKTPQKLAGEDAGAYRGGVGEFQAEEKSGGRAYAAGEAPTGLSHTTVFVVTRRAVACSWPRTEPASIALRTFPKRHHIRSAEEFAEGLAKADFAKWFSDGNDEYLTYADARETALLSKIARAGKTDKDKDFYSNRCDGLDRQIDALVYELYGLTADEIKIVEGTAA